MSDKKRRRKEEGERKGPTFAEATLHFSPLLPTLSPRLSLRAQSCPFSVIAFLFHALERRSAERHVLGTLLAPRGCFTRNLPSAPFRLLPFPSLLCVGSADGLYFAEAMEDMKGQRT